MRQLNLRTKFEITNQEAIREYDYTARVPFVVEETDKSGTANDGIFMIDKDNTLIIKKNGKEHQLILEDNKVKFKEI